MFWHTVFYVTSCKSNFKLFLNYHTLNVMFFNVQYNNLKLGWFKMSNVCSLHKKSDVSNPVTSWKYTYAVRTRASYRPFNFLNASIFPILDSFISYWTNNSRMVGSRHVTHCPIPKQISFLFFFLGYNLKFGRTSKNTDRLTLRMPSKFYLKTELHT